MEKLRYSEIFYSVQGEGRFVGVPSVFFRTFGCNFHCHGFGQGRDKSKWLKPEEMPYATMEAYQFLWMLINIIILMP